MSHSHNNYNWDIIDCGLKTENKINLSKNSVILQWYNLSTAKFIEKVEDNIICNFCLKMKLSIYIIIFKSHLYCAYL